MFQIVRFQGEMAKDSYKPRKLTFQKKYMYFFLLDAMISSHGFPSWHDFPLHSLFLLDTTTPCATLVSNILFSTLSHD